MLVVLLQGGRCCLIPMAGTHTYHKDLVLGKRQKLTRKTHHDKKAIMNPSHAKKKTRPYLLKGLRTGIDRAFPLTGLISGACQRVATLNPMVGDFPRYSLLYKSSVQYLTVIELWVLEFECRREKNWRSVVGW